MRRNKSDISFIYGIVNGYIDSNYLLSRLNFYVPRINSRARATFYLPSSRRDVHKYAPIKRMSQLINNTGANLDIFCNKQGD